MTFPDDKAGGSSREGNKDAIWSKQNAGLTQREKKDLKEKLEEDAKVRYNMNQNQIYVASFYDIQQWLFYRVFNSERVHPRFKTFYCPSNCGGS